MNYRLIVVDMDGTLLSNKHDISEENKRVLKEAMARGVKVAIATGRIYTSARFYAKILGIATPIIACNGAFIRDDDRDKVIYCNPMKQEDVIKIAKLCKDHEIYFQFYGQDKMYIEELKYSARKYYEWNLKQERENQIQIIRLDDTMTYLQENDIKVLKMIIMDEDLEKLAKVKKSIEEISSIEINKSWYDNIEIMNKGVSKGQAIKALGEILNISKEEIIAFGDNYNDLSMKDYVKTFVAMGNGEEYVKQQASYITADNDKDGVAEGIRRLVFGQESP
ncbi:Cof-type HAD-IIB family hydrolase [Natronincola ferrireducens]|uniref:Cof subfamily of IIB subfamily of haloacid dehalogenase superfamily/HAD-superfamily hydrolase, subfamily IIB n=1 Tax=Natronincola ferrireducens TaxID=393762 RepID=A0A1G9E1R7_9FIRM|nr:Cof-type HAD-IIB family hydrolase [Natronincola ferrireducens]SDK70030.1 hypothetical protein SAMN05660472_01807 [Natronincola ferrireducens]